ncbi:hypothetical protein DQ04_00721030 [Trypanosoma grayi]|uniref:hypothetical protein n=1 Tax=Trypanosoma grayi TaxID=71804 RepID=UPI0004F480D6|nr:hypothetical protein DQ04_00721030 [Trypanosoma grayi]KEG13901.1 hypothetical protein DQ04_00721030 [Trypanosoma grayi]
MSAETKTEKEDQNKTLGRLQWLIQRSKVGYKGNPPPFDTLKKQKSVELAKKRAAKELVADVDFLPFRHGGPSLAEDARPSKHLRDVDNTKFEVQANRDDYNYCHQRIDRVTGRPEIVSALCWDLKVENGSPATAGRSCRNSTETHFLNKKGAVRGFSNAYLATLSREERAAIYRADILNHPKFTKESREYWGGDAWYRGSQLQGPPHLSVDKPPVALTRNCICMRGSCR